MRKRVGEKWPDAAQILTMTAMLRHASKDAALTVRLEELLEEDGLDLSEIRLGVLLQKELQTAIKNSRVLILLWSKAAAKSRWEVIMHCCIEAR